MIKNVSNSAYTVKNMFNLLDSDSWSIDRTLYYCNYENSCILECGTILDKYKTYFDQFLDEVEIDSKYFYSPQKFAEDYYGDAGLDFLVLYFANMTSNFDFIKPKIKVLSYNKLKEVNQLFTRYKIEVDASKANPTTYSSIK